MTREELTRTAIDLAGERNELKKQVKKLTLKNKELTEQLRICDVGKSFYCLERNIKGKNYECLNQCNACKTLMK